MRLTNEQLDKLERNAKEASTYANQNMRQAGEMTIADDGRAALFWKVQELITEVREGRAVVEAAKEVDAVVANFDASHCPFGCYPGDDPKNRSHNSKRGRDGHDGDCPVRTIRASLDALEADTA